MDRWSMENFLSLQEYITFVEDEDSKRLVCDVMRRFATHVTPRLSLLRRGILHNDIARTNLLLETKDKSFKISGLIDFGDIRYSCLLFELVNTVASFINKDDVLVDSGHLIAGYQAAFSLPEMEFELLYDSVSARLCHIYLITSKEVRQNPENEHLVKTLMHYATNMKAWLKNSKDEAMKYWREVGLSS